MGFNRFNGRLAGFILVMGALAILAAFWWFAGGYLWSGIAAFVFLIVAGRLYHFLGKTNRDLSLFFEGMLNEDSSLNLEKGVAPPGFDELKESLLRLRSAIRKERVHNRFQEQFYAELIGHSGSGLLAYDEQGKVIIANPALLELLELHHLTSVKTLEHRVPEFYQKLQRLKPGKPLLYKFTVNGQVVVLQLRASEFIFGDKHYHLLALQNIKAELEEREVESWQKLFRIMSHEIMNSIAPITSLAQSIGRSLPEEVSEICTQSGIDIGRIRNSAGAIEEQGDLMMSFVERYRKLYKIPEPVLKPIAIEDWLSRFRILYHQEMQQRNIQFNVNVSNGITEFTADDKLISQVVINLLKNAVEAVSEVEHAEINLSVQKGEQETRIVVADNGVGIPEEYADQVFVPFFTTRQGGSGIGLALSRQIVHRHSGTLSFHSIPGMGTTFTVVLPG